MKMNNIKLQILLFAFIVTAFARTSSAQTTTFTYQGKLSDGATTASGTYDLGFALYDAGTGGTQIGTALTRPNVTVSGGIFTVQLDFDATAFAAGANRFLEIAVKKTSETDFTTLTPRQMLTSSPFSIQALGAKTSDGLSANCVLCVTNAQISSIDGGKVTGRVAYATTAGNATNATAAAFATNAENANSLGSVAAANYLLKNGDGSQLTNLPVQLLPWETVTAATQAQANRGYVAANDSSQVYITLPANPAVGHIVRVTGAGAGGWRISQNDNQSIGGANFGLPNQWTMRESDREWYSVASSSDGTKLVTVSSSGPIYTSINSGATWTARESGRSWQSAASSADGTKLVAVVNGGQIYTAAYGTSSSGTAGYLTGGQNSVIEFQYVGGGKFIILSSQGTINSF